MGTICEITAYGEERASVEAGVEATFEEIRRLETVMSTYRADSELSRLNREAAHRPVACSEDLFAVLEQSQEYSRRTGGAFDVTVHPLIELWGFESPRRLPTAEEVSQTTAQVGYWKLILESKTRQCAFSEPGMAVNLGGIGKGYALDKAVELLRRHGVFSALVNFGGQLYALGQPPGEGAWQVRLVHPLDPTKTVAQLWVSDRAVSTSANSERFIKVRGKHYGHILNPRTGYPAERRGSITVISASAAEADALSTGLFVMTDNGVSDFAEAHPEIAVLVMAPISDTSSKLQIQSWNAERYRIRWSKRVFGKSDKLDFFRRF